jgi:hypothetical protein
VEHHLEQNISEFLKQRIAVAGFDGLDELITFLDEVGDERLVRHGLAPHTGVKHGTHRRGECVHLVQVLGHRRERPVFATIVRMMTSRSSVNGG